MPALGLLTLAGLLPPDWTCEYLPVEEVSDEFMQDVIRKKPDLVAFSALTASIGEAYALSGRLRDEGLSVVIGGLHATACAEEATQHCDAVVVGPGESVWPDVLRDAEAGALLPIYRGRDPLHAAWPLPRFDLLGGTPARLTLQTQRGCPLACEFCGASRLLGRFREKPVGDIQRELASIRDIDSQPLIELADDNTFAGSRNVAGRGLVQRAKATRSPTDEPGKNRASEEAPPATTRR